MGQSWQEIRQEALRRIHAREWAPGDTIPNEADLAEELGCARSTVNRALRDLAQAGWLERRRKAGTRVRPAPERRAQLAIPLIRQEIETRGGRFAFTLLSRRDAPLPNRVRAVLGLTGDPPAQHLQTLYLSDGTPYAFEDRWVSLDGAPGFAEAGFDALSPNEWLVQNAAFAHGTLDYSAAPASREEARHLGCDAGTPVMVLDRSTFGPAAPVTVVRVTYAPGHRLHLNI